MQKEDLVKGPESAVLCLSSLIRFYPPNEMKVGGKFLEKEVVALSDSGVSHNFISEKFVTESNLPRTPTHEFSVQTKKGKEVKNTDVCKGVQLQLEGLDVMVDF